jgi:EmrB/QacA subfamily drug resistance transporter
MADSTAPQPYDRVVPLIVAVALFMENMDSTVIGTSLPAIAQALGTNPLALKLAVTSYLLALAIFIPASGWIADRFGARHVFRSAIIIFIVGSIGCALSRSLPEFVLARILQGAGGAMMTPVGRLILVRSIDKRLLLNAMALVTIPALIGPICGPPLGGFITTYFSWHWIFIINVPIGVLGVIMATLYVPDVQAERPGRFDFVGFVLSGFGIGGLAFGLSVLGLALLPLPWVAGLLTVGAICTAAYIFHALRAPAPILDLRLFKLATFRASIIGGFLFRLGIGALPFLLPLLLQIGFNLTPFQSGLITFTAAIGSISMKTVVAIILKRFGYRPVLVYNSLISAVFLGACALFSLGVPFAIMIAILLAGGFFRSLQFTAINTIAYAEIDPPLMSRATTLTSVAQQLAISTGVAVGALVVEITLLLSHRTAMTAADFPPAFLLVAASTAAASLVFLRLPKDAGAELTGHDEIETKAEAAEPQKS